MQHLSNRRSATPSPSSCWEISSLPNHPTPSQIESSAQTSLPPELGGVRNENQGLKGGNPKSCPSPLPRQPNAFTQARASNSSRLTQGVATDSSVIPNKVDCVALPELIGREPRAKRGRVRGKNRGSNQLCDPALPRDPSPCLRSTPTPSCLSSGY